MQVGIWSATPTDDQHLNVNIKNVVSLAAYKARKALASFAAPVAVAA